LPLKVRKVTDIRSVNPFGGSFRLTRTHFYSLFKVDIELKLGLGLIQMLFL